MAVIEVRVKDTGLTAFVGEREAQVNAHLYERLKEPTPQTPTKAINSASKKGKN